MRKTVANKGQRPKTLTGRTVKRIARAVNAFERGDRDIPGRRFSKSVGDWSDRLRVGKVAAAWDINTTATVTLWEGGTPPSETESDPAETLEDVVNHLQYVAAGVFVLVASGEAGAWYLVASEMPPVLTGTFSAPWDKGSTKTVTVEFTPSNSESAVSLEITAINKFADVVGSGSRQCAVAHNGEEFCLIAAEC